MVLMILYKPFDSRIEGNLKVFEALQDGLGDNYIIFHSVRWVASTKKS